MRISAILPLLAAAQAAPIIRTIVHTANPVTQMVTKTTNTVVHVNTVVQTVNGPPPQQNAEPTNQPNTQPNTQPATQPADTHAAQPTEATPANQPTQPTTPATQTPSTQETTPAEPPATESPTTESPAQAPTTESPTTQTPTTPATTQSPTSTTPATTPATTQSPTSTPATSTTSTSTSSPTSGGDGPSGDFEKDILQAHNDKRALHGVQSLSWDSKLADYAANYAKNSFSCDNVQLIHSNGPYGENLAAGLVGGTDPVNAWYDEIKQYNYANPGFSEATGHFTQLVWKSTSKVGCAKVQCNNEWRQYTICEYSDSRGNVIGKDASGKSFFALNVVPPLKS